MARTLAYSLPNALYAYVDIVALTIKFSTVGGQTSARRNPTRTILGNQAIKQEANAYINIKQ
jgi:hypothetical protein